MISKLSKYSVKKAIFQVFDECRFKTLTLFEGIDEATFCSQPHPDFSPVGWHLGHIAYTESLWLLERSASSSCLFPQYRRLFAADGLPKSERVLLPDLEEIRYYLDTVREKVLEDFKLADIDQQERLWRFLIQHESQHCEIASFVLELVKRQNSTAETRRQSLQRGEPPFGFTVACGGKPSRSADSPQRAGSLIASVQESKVISYSPSLLSSSAPHPPALHPPLSPSPTPSTEMIPIPAGEFEQGSDSSDALDNERPLHRVYLDSYWIDRYPVTCRQYRAFMEAGGYENPRWWSQVGWQWLQTEQVKQPLYWHNDDAYGGKLRLWDNHPVCGVSWYEAQAYCQFVGKRLPTEAEWEKAASWDANANRRRTYPWGDGETTAQSDNCNCDRLIGKTTAVDAYPAGQSAYGLYDTLGNVWEWTASWFAGYDGFQSHPYIGYSQVYFDQQHRVLKGGSWATRSWVLRSSFRNWYHPGVRQIFAGFRCATSTVLSAEF